MIIALGSILVSGLIFGLGWTWPLFAGIVKRRKGKGGTGLIIFGGAWLVCILLFATALTGGGIWLAHLSKGWDTPEFNPSEFNGATAKLVALPDCSAMLSGESEYGSYNFTASNGVFTVPAGKFSPNSYTLTKEDHSGRVWTASWWYYGRTAMELNLTPDGKEPIKSAPPFTMTATRLETDNGDQRINVQIVDSNGDSVSLRSSQKPALEIVDATGSVVWSRALSYG